MALVKGPAGGIAASGTIGGTTFARNRAGQYARAWAKPVNPGTVRQSAVRGQFGNSSTHWSMLGPTDIDAWNAYAALLTRLNRLGEPYTPKGRQIYMETNNNLQQIVQAMIDTPSAYTDNPSITAINSLAATETAGVLDGLDVLSVLATIPSAAGNSSVIFDATPPHDPKLTNVNNLFRQVFMDKISNAPFDLLAKYILVFGDAALTGQIISVRARVVDSTSGLGSAYILADATIT